MKEDNKFSERFRNHFLGVLDKVLSTVTVWKIISFLCLILAAVSIFGLIHVSSQSKVKTVLIVLDDKYNPIGAYYDKGGISKKADPRVLKAALANFVVSLREVTLDRANQDRSLRKLSLHVGKDSRAAQKVSQIYDNVETNPYDRAAKELVRVNILSVLDLTEDSYQVVWEESVFSRSSKKRVSLEQLKVRIHFTFLKEVPPEIFLVNPIGLVITDFNMIP